MHCDVPVHEWNIHDNEDVDVLGGVSEEIQDEYATQEYEEPNRNEPWQYIIEEVHQL